MRRPSYPRSWRVTEKPSAPPSKKRDASCRLANVNVVLDRDGDIHIDRAIHSGERDLKMRVGLPHGEVSVMVRAWEDSATERDGET
jgi:hypothetical protein